MKALLLSLAAAGILSGCVVLDDGPRHGRAYGPPAHAPAHGYRRHHRGYDMSYDSGLGVYLVIGRPGYYWWDDHYWRLIDGHWHWSVDLYSPWRVVAIDRVPHHLYRRYPDRGLHRGHERGDDHERDHEDRGHEHRERDDREHDRDPGRHYEDEDRGRSSEKGHSSEKGKGSGKSKGDKSRGKGKDR